MDIKTISDFRRAMRHGPYAWPGGYPCFFVTSDSAALSFKAAKQEQRLIIEAIRNKLDDGWRVIGFDVNWEDANLYCDHAGERIESAYAEDVAAIAKAEGQS
jgi:uncharacterized membrane protein